MLRQIQRQMNSMSVFSSVPLFMKQQWRQNDKRDVDKAKHLSDPAVVDPPLAAGSCGFWSDFISASHGCGGVLVHSSPQRFFSSSASLDIHLFDLDQVTPKPWSLYFQSFWCRCAAVFGIIVLSHDKAEAVRETTFISRRVHAPPTGPHLWNLRRSLRRFAHKSPPD